MPHRASQNSTSAQKLIHKISNRSAHLGVVGLGYVGLPLAVEFAHAGFRVTGIDIDDRRIESLSKGRSYIQDVPTKEVRALVRSGHLTATTDFSVLKRMDAVNVCVPTPLSKQRDPDVSYIVAASQQVARHLHKGMLVISSSPSRPSASIPATHASTRATFRRSWAV
jgi:UDP-N-acetyl-D-glucosamine dehydrogenase